MTSKHTPGPWRAALDHNSRPIVWGPGKWEIADCWHTPDGNGWGNARLIAASPRMYSYVESRADAGDEEAKKIIAEVSGA